MVAGFIPFKDLGIKFFESLTESLHKIPVLGQLIGNTDALGTWYFPKQLCSLPSWESFVGIIYGLKRR